MPITHLYRRGLATNAGGNLGAALPTTVGARYEIQKVSARNITNSDATITIKEDPTSGDDAWITALDLLVPANSQIEAIVSLEPCEPGSSFNVNASADNAVWVVITLVEIT